MSPTRILRMEAANGDGPYQGEKVSSNTACDMLYELDQGARMQLQPIPSMDLNLSDPYNAMRFRADHDILFGFADDGESLNRWWPKPIQGRMAVEGFEPRSLMAVHVLHGTRQVVYYTNSEAVQ